MPKIIPLHATLHYKCAFDIYPKKTTNNKSLISQVIFEIQKWAGNKVKKDKQDDSKLKHLWFFNGRDLNEPASLGEHQIRTAAILDSSDNILSWFYEHIDEDLNKDSRAREWTTEITLKSFPEEGFVRFVTVNKHYIKPYHLGKIPDAPDASVPRFVDSILKEFLCRRDNINLSSSPIRKNNINGDCLKPLYDDLRSLERWLPFILVSKKRDSNNYCIDPIQIVEKVKGNANVYCLETNATIGELNYY